MSKAERKHSGRRGGDTNTRQDILNAALELFAQKGYDGTSMRQVALRAKVDPALVRHYFKNKGNLFSEALITRTQISAILADALHGDPESMGERVVRSYLLLWENPETAPVIEALFRSFSSTPETMDMFRETIMNKEVAPVSRLQEQELTRLALSITQVFGVAYGRYMMKIPYLADASLDEIVELLSPKVQRDFIDLRSGRA